jgi:hypothetical protein
MGIYTGFCAVVQFRTVLGMIKDSAIILDEIRRSFFLPDQQQQRCLPQFESILDGHVSRHLLAPSPVSKLRILPKNV